MSSFLYYFFCLSTRVNHKRSRHGCQGIRTNILHCAFSILCFQQYIFPLDRWGGFVYTRQAKDRKGLSHIYPFCLLPQDLLCPLPRHPLCKENYQTAISYRGCPHPIDMRYPLQEYRL